MKIGENLKASREESGKSVYQVEKETKINHSQIYRWEREENEPTISQCIKLADCYGIRLDELVGREFGHCESVHAQAVQINNGGNNTQNNFFGANNRERGNGITNK